MDSFRAPFSISKKNVSATVNNESWLMIIFREILPYLITVAVMIIFVKFDHISQLWLKCHLQVNLRYVLPRVYGSYTLGFYKFV